MEENKKYRRGINQSFSSKSVLGSLALSIIAVLAVAVLGFNSSYAVPEISSRSLGDKFTTNEPGETVLSDTGFAVLPYSTTIDGKDFQLFCLERRIGFLSNTEYLKDDGITDYGLLYVMASIEFRSNNDPTFKALNQGLKTWISQSAIWMYLYEQADLSDDIDDNVPEYLDAENTQINPHYLTPEELAAIRTAKGVTVGDDVIYHTLEGQKTETSEVQALTTTLYDAYIKDLVAVALANQNTPNMQLLINVADEISITQDEKYYQTSAVTVSGNPSDNFNGYELKISKAPEGTFVVDVNGNKIEDLSNFGVNDKVYFRVPVANVTEDNKLIEFSVTGVFSTYNGYYYKCDGGQTISSVDITPNNISKGDEISLDYTPKVPDTGMSTAQTVYFIGLIILLSGIGIIYANVKPEESL